MLVLFVLLLLCFGLAFLGVFLVLFFFGGGGLFLFVLFVAIFGVFPQFYSKKWPKRDVANLPHLSIYVFDKTSPKMAWDCSPRHF